MECASFETQEKLDQALEYLGGIFDVARIVDPILTDVQSCDDQPSSLCFSVWQKDRRCRNCTSSRVLITGEPAHKFERIGDDIFLVTSERVNTPNGPAVLELVSLMEQRFREHYHLQQEEFSRVEELSIMAYQDPLTGVFNRRYAEEGLPKLVSSVREQPGSNLLVAMLDVDHLKDVNDRWGHLAGDLLLTTVVSHVLDKTGFDGEDDGFLSRTGGDEFMLVKRLDSTEQATEYLNAILANVAQANIGLAPGAPVSVSCGGLMLSETTSDSWIDLVSIADHRLYVAKRSGRGVAVLNDAIDFDPPAAVPNENRKYRRDEPFHADDGQ